MSRTRFTFQVTAFLIGVSLFLSAVLAGAGLLFGAPVRWSMFRDAAMIGLAAGIIGGTMQYGSEKRKRGW